MNRYRVMWICTALVALLGVLILDWAGAARAWAAELPAARVYQVAEDLPSRNWRVCRDLGIGNVPGVGQRQRVKLCHPSGYAVRAYCINPGAPVPPLGTTCTLGSNNVFSCGSGLQALRLYTIVATPQATGTPEVTLTPLPTATLTPTATNTPVSPQASATPRGRENRRPRPGGGSNTWLAGGAALAAGAGLLLGGVWLTLYAMQRKASSGTEE